MKIGRATESSESFRVSDYAIDSDTHVVELGGEVDLYTAPAFKGRMAELLEEGRTDLVVDLSQVTFIDSAALGVLVGGVKRLRPKGGSLGIVCTNQTIIGLLEVAGLDQVFPIHATVEAALAGRRAGRGQS